MTEFVVQSWNLWFGGTKVKDHLDKQTNIVQNYPADVVCFQECWHSHAYQLAQKVGVPLVQNDFDNAIMSAHEAELVETGTAPFAVAAWLNINGEKILVWSVHLSPIDYGPYAALRGEPAEDIHATSGELTRLEQIERVLAWTERVNPQQAPVIIAGDFNTPSTSDWAQRSDRPDIAWPAVDVVFEAGFIDAFRSIYPDAERIHSDTWSPIESLDNEPRDRIDFIFVKGLEVIDAKTRGNWVDHRRDESFEEIPGLAKLIPEHEDNTYPSDHMMVEVVLAQKNLN